MTEHTATITSIERYLKIARINRFLEVGTHTLTYAHGSMTFPIDFIDEQAHVFGETEGAWYRIEMGNREIDELYTFVLEHEVQP